MSESDQKLPEGKPAGEGNQEGSEGSKQQAQEPQYTEVELQALDQGWKPLDKWEGPKEGHRSAREYLDRGELLGKIKAQSNQLEEVKRALIGMSEHNKKVYAAGYETALKELKTQKLMALKEGDAEAVLAIDDKIDEHKEAIRNIKSAPEALKKGPSTTSIDWLNKNGWYAKDLAMQGAANSFAAEYMRTHQNPSEESVYEYIDMNIKKEFPHKFQKTVAPNPEGEGRRAVGGKGGGSDTFEKLVSSMTEDQARIARTLVKSGAITKEKYVQDFNSISGN